MPNLTRPGPYGRPFLAWCNICLSIKNSQRKRWKGKGERREEECEVGVEDGKEGGRSCVKSCAY